MDAIEILAECWSDAWAAAWLGTYGFFNSDEEVKYWRNADWTAGGRLENAGRAARKWCVGGGLHVNRLIVVRNSQTNRRIRQFPEDVDIAMEIRRKGSEKTIDN